MIGIFVFADGSKRIVQFNVDGDSSNDNIDDDDNDNQICDMMSF